MKEIKLSEYAKLKNRCYRTLWNHFHEGRLQNAYKSDTGSIYVKLDDDKKDEYTVLYCRVSSHDQKEDLIRQIDRLSNFAINNGYTIQKVYHEIASGLNDDRIQLNRLLQNDKITTVIIEHKDRLTRFGFNNIKTLTNRLGINIIIVNESNDIVNDIMEDFISVITSFCARIYGKRRTKRQTENIIKKLC
jgi:predicted site-specific integrase-resolvase